MPFYFGKQLFARGNYQPIHVIEHYEITLSDGHTVTDEQFKRMSAERELIKRNAESIMEEFNLAEWMLVTAKTEANAFGNSEQSYKVAKAIDIVSGRTDEYKNIIKFECWCNTDFAEYLNNKLKELKENENNEQI